jgi:hypothetical protein
MGPNGGGAFLATPEANAHAIYKAGLVATSEDPGPQSPKALAWGALADLRRLKLISEGRLPTE